MWLSFFAQSIWLFDGLVVSVTGDINPALNGLYFLSDATNYSDTASWQKLETLSGGTYTFVQSGATIISQNGVVVTIFTPVTPSDLSGFTDYTGLLFNKAYSGLTGKPDLSIYQTISSFSAFTNTTLPADYYNKVQVDGLISGFTTGNTFTESGATIITQSGGNINIFSPITPSDLSGFTDNSGLLFNKAYSGLTGKPDLSIYETSGDTLILINQSISGFSGNTIYNLESPAAITLGGITAGDILTGKTSNEILEELLVPTLYPSFVAPSNSFSKISPSTNLYEIANVIDIDFGAAFNRGSISPAYGTSGYRSGLPKQYNYSGSGLPASNVSNSLTDSQNATSYSVISGYQSWTSTVTYLTGDQPKNSKGGNYSSPLASGTTGAVSLSIEGVYPLYATTTLITILAKQALVSMINANNIQILMVAETGGNKQKFEIADAWLSARTLLGVQTYNTVSAQWEYQGASAANSLTYWDVTSNTETVQGNNITYSRYTYNGTDRSDINIRLVF